jgi:dipeptidyl-peptidase-4
MPFFYYLSVTICTMKKIFSFLFTILLLQQLTYAQSVNWGSQPGTYYRIENKSIVRYTLPARQREVFADSSQLVPKGKTTALNASSFATSADDQLVLIFTNTKKVWRYNTRGDYWVLNKKTGNLSQVGKQCPASTLMFAKLSPDGKKVAYVSEYNLYVEDLQSGKAIALTKNGHRKLINGTFDWAYEEEFFCRDGFRWSPDSKNIAFWEVDAAKVKDHYMINNTDSIYPQLVPVEYPVAGELPSPVRIGVVNIASTQLKWMDLPYDKQNGSYIPRIAWHPASKEVAAQWMNRKQNESKVLFCDISTGKTRTVLSETDNAWIDIMALWDTDYQNGGWDWLNGGKQFIWPSEQDGWRHIYTVNAADGKTTLVTKGNYDVIDLVRIDTTNGYVYFLASPTNATQRALHRVKLDGSSSSPERISPAQQQGWHTYNVSPDGRFAFHSFSNRNVPNVSEWIEVQNHQPLTGNAVNDAVTAAASKQSNIEFFTVKTAEGIDMDAWMVKPLNFDATKKYPIVFLVYTEPWGQNVQDKYGATNNFMYAGNMAQDGYLYVSVDNRGTPVPKGREWRKSIYRKFGQINIRDQAMAAREILKNNFVDTSRVAVWGWSGGGTATLNLMFQYPDIYKTGISVAAVGNAATYDNIYEERYMGIPQEAAEDYKRASPITYAAGLKGNLLYIHGTGDDNVHYNNAEMLLNELIRYNKQFQFMAYPNRTHSISEGEGTFQHLSTLYTNYLRTHCAPGAR